MTITRTCRVRPYERRLPPKRCGLDNRIHRLLRQEVDEKRFVSVFVKEFNAALHRAMAGEAR